MADKSQANQPQPIVKIGHYTLGQTLGVGTFGKVKSMTIIIFFHNALFNCKVSSLLLHVFFLILNTNIHNMLL